MTRLLLVEDDRTLGETLVERLEKEGYEIDWAMTLSDARKKLKENEHELMLLDVRLPDGTGFDLAEEIGRGNVPFLFLTAQADAKERLKGFELGAEDFIPKPFHLKELFLRIKHVLGAHRHIVQKTDNEIIYAGYRINLKKFAVYTPAGSETRLSKRDCNLLELLIREKERAVSRDEILDKLWGEDSFPTNRTIDNSILRLRQAFGSKGADAIESIRGVGYRWRGELNNG